MKRTCLLFLCVTVLPGQQIGGGVQEQGPLQGTFSFQPAQSLAAARGGRGTVMAVPRAEKGKPFSATVTSQTVQTFIDGTHVSRTTTMVEYRDAEGRVRTETSLSGNSTPNILIRDTVAGYSYRLNPLTKSAVKVPGAAQPALTPQQLEEKLQSLRDMAAAMDAGTQPATSAGRGARSNPNQIVEDLGIMAVNGVPARGTRVTTIVPAGEIGNDREFRNVDERWFSSDLNLLIKSTNTDPRFGTTTYELTNISRQPPDPSLFQVPADYTISNGGRGRQ